MKKFLPGLVGAIMLVSAAPSSFAIDKLDVTVEVGEHPFLPDFEFGTSGTLGDVWTLDIVVMDTDGEPAEGAKVRIYNGKKSVGTGRVSFNGVAEIKLTLNKLGTQNLRVVATDDDPSGKGEVTFRLEVVKPRILQAVTKVTRSEYNQPDEIWIRPDALRMIEAGCFDTNKYWTSYSTEYLKSGRTELSFSNSTSPATWPFTTTKRKGMLYNSYRGLDFKEILKSQVTLPYIQKDKYAEYEIDNRDIIDEPFGTQILCQTDTGDLIIVI